MFDDLMNSTIDLLRQDGAQHLNIRAVVNKNKITIYAGHLVIEPGDSVRRPTSNGAIEMYEVIDPGFHEADGVFPKHYQMEVKRLPSDAAKAQKQPAPAQDNLRLSPLPGLHPDIAAKCSSLFASGHYAEAVEKSFKVVRDRLRTLTGFEKGAEAFGKGKLRVAGASAPHVEDDFNEAVKFMLMAIDFFRNEKAHTSDAKITNPVRAEHYLMLSSLAMYLLDGAATR